MTRRGWGSRDRRAHSRPEDLDWVADRLLQIKPWRRYSHRGWCGEPLHGMGSKATSPHSFPPSSDTRCNPAFKFLRPLWRRIPASHIPLPLTDAVLPRLSPVQQQFSRAVDDRQGMRGDPTSSRRVDSSVEWLVRGAAGGLTRNPRRHGSQAQSRMPTPIFSTGSPPGGW